jgi:hypothetical protein
MRLHVLRLVAVVALALAAAALLGLMTRTLSASTLTEGANTGTGQPPPVTKADPNWAASAQAGDLQRISYSLADIGARRAISDPGINSPLTLAENGRKVVVTGHVNCTLGEDYEIQTAVTQRTTGAMAKGRTVGRCSGREQQFEAATWVYDQALFQPGKGQACAILITRSRNAITDVFQWCRKEDVELAVARTGY